MKFCFKILKMIENIEIDVDRLLLASKMIKSSNLPKYIGFFFHYQTQK